MSTGDPLYNDAVDLVRTVGGFIGCSFLQRRLGIGYVRASRLIDEMIVGGILRCAVGGYRHQVIAPYDKSSPPTAMPAEGFSPYSTETTP